MPARPRAVIRVCAVPPLLPHAAAMAMREGQLNHIEHAGMGHGFT